MYTTFYNSDIIEWVMLESTESRFFSATIKAYVPQWCYLVKAAKKQTGGPQSGGLIIIEITNVPRMKKRQNNHTVCGRFQSGIVGESWVSHTGRPQSDY